MCAVPCCIFYTCIHPVIFFTVCSTRMFPPTLILYSSPSVISFPGFITIIVSLFHPEMCVLSSFHHSSFMTIFPIPCGPPFTSQTIFACFVPILYIPYSLYAEFHPTLYTKRLNWPMQRHPPIHTLRYGPGVIWTIYELSSHFMGWLVSGLVMVSHRELIFGPYWIISNQSLYVALLFSYSTARCDKLFFCGAVSFPIHIPRVRSLGFVWVLFFFTVFFLQSPLSFSWWCEWNESVYWWW